MVAHTISSDILLSYTIPLSYLLSVYILYVAVQVLLILDDETYLVFVLLHYIPALVYVVHKIAANFSVRNILVFTVSFVLFPLHFILTLYYKIMFSLKIFKSNPSQPDEITSLLDKVRADNPLHTFLILFTCVQIPLEVFLQMALYLNHFRNGTGTTILVTMNLTLSLLLFTYGAVSYFRFETQNINQYLPSRVNLKRIQQLKVQAAKTYSKATALDTSRRISQFQVESPSKLEITDSHSLIFKLVVSVKWLLHNYIRLVSVGLVLFYYPTFTMLFFASQTILLFLLLLFLELKSRGKLFIGYDVLQSVVLNFCLIEFKMKLLNRKLVFLSYFLVIFAENLLFNYLWYFTANSTRRYRSLFNATIWSLIVCQIAHFVLLFIYLAFYKPEMYEIDYYAGETEDEGTETNLSENEEDIIGDIDEEGGNTEDGTQTGKNRNYENVAQHTDEREKKTTRVNVDRIRTQTNDASQKGTQVRGQKVAFDNMIYAESEKRKSLITPISKHPSNPTATTISKYKELINDTEEQTIYTRTSSNAETITSDGRPKKSQDSEESRKSLTANYGVNPEQRDSWKYIVEEIDDQIHKSTSNLHKNKLHLSSDRLSRKYNRSTDSLDRTDPPRVAPGQLYQQKQTQQPTQYQQNQKNLFETSSTQSYSHIKQGPTSTADVLSPHANFTDRHSEEEIAMENKAVDSNLENRRTSRYSSQEFVETRRLDETTYEERKMNVKKLNTTSLV